MEPYNERKEKGWIGFAIVASMASLPNALADWPAFRGVGGNAVVADAKLPAEFGGEANKAVAWKTKLPGRSVGGPVVIGNKVITNSAGGVDAKRLTVSCLDTTSGKLLWEQAFRATGERFIIQPARTLPPPPALTANAFFTFYSSNDLICLDLDGNLCGIEAWPTIFRRLATISG